MTEQDKTNTSQDNQNTPDNNTTEQTTTQHNAPHYITKSPQHNTKKLPLQVLEVGTSGNTPVVELSEEQLAFVREWVEGMLMSPESVKMIGEYMDRKAKAQQRLWGGYVSYVNGDGGEERISLMEAEERAIQDWWKDEKGEI